MMKEVRVLKINDYPEIEDLTLYNKLLVESEDEGTRTVTIDHLYYQLLESFKPEWLNNPELLGKDFMELEDADFDVINYRIPIIDGTNGGIKKAMIHNIYKDIMYSASSNGRVPLRPFRGAYLGSSVTNTQLLEIYSGSFKNLFLGDYWKINGINWRIVDFNYWCLTTGFTSEGAIMPNHLVIMPDTVLTTSKMFNTRNTNNGFVGSLVYTESIPECLSIIESAFGSDKLLDIQTVLTNAVSNGAATGGIWSMEKVIIPNELMVYGTNLFSPTTNADGSGFWSHYTPDQQQLALFGYDKIWLNRDDIGWWLRDFVSTTFGCVVVNNCIEDVYNVDNVKGVRPCFALGTVSNPT